MGESCGYSVRDRVGKSSGACGLMVSPADVPASYDFNSLICPSRTKAAFEHKRRFPQLSSLRSPHSLVAASNAERERLARNLAEATDDLYRHDAAARSNATFRLGSYARGNATRRATEKRCGPEVRPDRIMKAVPKASHTDGRVLARFDRNVETHRQARPHGTHLGNMTKGRSRRAAERKVYHATFGSLAWVRN